MYSTAKYKPSCYPTQTILTLGHDYSTEREIKKVQEETFEMFFDQASHGHTNSNYSLAKTIEFCVCEKHLILSLSQILVDLHSVLYLTLRSFSALFVCMKLLLVYYKGLFF